MGELLTIGQSELVDLPAHRFKPAAELRQTVLDCLEIVSRAQPQASPERFEDMLEQAGIVLSVAPDAEAIELTSNKSAFHHVCSNLIRNAIRFKKSQVVVDVSLNSNWLEVQVSDDGPGIPSAHREAIFEPYTQAPGAAEGSGHGLGLAMARTLTRRLGGDISVEDRDSEGITFRVRVPLGDPME